jgi:hypothetical protein
MYKIISKKYAFSLVFLLLYWLPFDLMCDAQGKEECSYNEEYRTSAVLIVDSSHNESAVNNDKMPSQSDTSQKSNNYRKSYCADNRTNIAIILILALGTWPFVICCTVNFIKNALHGLGSTSG